jgi:hypothetical protein
MPTIMTMLLVVPSLQRIWLLHTAPSSADRTNNRRGLVPARIQKEQHFSQTSLTAVSIPFGGSVANLEGYGAYSVYTPFTF